MKLLLVDDQSSDRAILRKVLRQLPDLEVLEADSLAAARSELAAHEFDGAIIDLRLGEDLRNRDGHVLIRELKGRSTVAIVWTAMREVEEIREAMRNGAYDYIFKDAPHRELVERVIEGLRARKMLQDEVLEHRARGSLDNALLHGMVGSSVVMQQLRRDIQAVAAGSDKPVLVLGPSGSGKELVARGVHAMGPNPNAPFVAKNCASIPESLFESEMFGHEDQAFTGAKRRAGALAATQKGTLFLDEIGEMPPGQQAKLLRVIESRRYAALGSDIERSFQGRIVAATHVDLEARVNSGAFRHDLYMRLSFFPLTAPRLSERPEDIPDIIAHYLKAQGLSPMRLTAEAVANLQAREWPGNVRELQQVVERLAITLPPEAEVTAEAIDRAMRSPAPEPGDIFRAVAKQLLDRVAPANLARSEADREARVDIAHEVVAAIYTEALARSGQRKAPAARLVGTDRRVIERFFRRESDGADGTSSGGPG